MSRRVRGRRSGQALVEFALVVPIFLLILFGLLDVGRAIFAYNSITNAAREGARLAIVNQDSASIEARAADQAPAQDITSTVRFSQPAPNADAASNPPCEPIGIGCVAVVRVTTPWQALTPIVGALLGPITLRAETQQPVEFVCPNPAIAGFTTAGDCPKQP